LKTLTIVTGSKYAAVCIVDGVTIALDYKYEEVKPISLYVYKLNSPIVRQYLDQGVRKAFWKCMYTIVNHDKIFLTIDDDEGIICIGTGIGAVSRG